MGSRCDEETAVCVSEGEENVSETKMHNELKHGVVI